MKTKGNDEIKEKLIKLHSEKKTNTEIGEILGVDTSTISSGLSKLNLVSNFYLGNSRKRTKNTATQQIIYTDPNQKTAICSKCHEEKPITEFQYGRKGTPQEYRFSYCNSCRKKQVYDNLNKDFDKGFKDKYNRCKARAIREKIPFALSYDYFKEIYEKQNHKCFYLDCDMTGGVNKGKSRYAISLDKVIPEKGYIEGNVVFCCNKINSCKGDLTLEEIKRLMPLIYKKLIECEGLKIKEMS